MATPAKQLTAAEVGVILNLIHDGVRKTRRNQERGRRRWGESYDASVQLAREETLKSAYAKLGGDPKKLLDMKESMTHATGL